MSQTIYRSDGWVKSAIGPAVPGAQVFVCAPQPANLTVPPTPLADIFSDSAGLVPITQPIITDGFGHYDFYTAPGLYTVIVILAGKIQAVYPDQSLGGIGSGGGTGLTLQTNGVQNAVQTLLNLLNGDNVTITPNGSGGVTISATASGAEIQVNGTPTPDQALQNFINTSTISWAADGSGGLRAVLNNLPAAQAINNVRIWKAIANSGSLGSNVGFAGNPTATSDSSSLIGATATDTCYSAFSTSASGGDQATITFCGVTGSGINPNVFQIYSTQTLSAIKWRMLLPSTADIRIWLGLADAYTGNVGNLVSDDPAGMHVIGFRYSTAAGDTTWQAVCNDGTGQTVVNTRVAPDTLGHTFSIVPTPSAIQFSIDNVVVATITTHIPADTVLFGDILSCDNVGLTNVKTFALNLVACLEP